MPVKKKPEPDPVKSLSEAEERMKAALEVAFDFGTFDGAHHKMWVIDQMVRALTARGYDHWVADFQSGVDGPETYEWDTGTPA